MSRFELVETQEFDCVGVCRAISVYHDAKTGKEYIVFVGNYADCGLGVIENAGTATAGALADAHHPGVAPRLP